MCIMVPLRNTSLPVTLMSWLYVVKSSLKGCLIRLLKMEINGRCLLALLLLSCMMSTTAEPEDSEEQCNSEWLIEDFDGKFFEKLTVYQRSVSRVQK